MITKQEIANGYDKIHERIGQSDEFYERCLALSGGVNYNNVNILDIGCGRGLLLKRMSNKYPKAMLHGLDISPKLCEISRQNNPNADILVGDAESLPYEDSVFDLIFMTETLEHLLDYKKSLSEVRRVLKPNGVFIVTVPNRDWLRYDFYNNGREKFQPIDDHYFRFDEIEKLLSGTGFKIEKYVGSDNLYYYAPFHIYERFLAFFMPFLHKRMKRLIFKCINIKK